MADLFNIGQIVDTVKWRKEMNMREEQLKGENEYRALQMDTLRQQQDKNQLEIQLLRDKVRKEQIHTYLKSDQEMDNWAKYNVGIAQGLEEEQVKPFLDEFEGQLDQMAAAGDNEHAAQIWGGTYGEMPGPTQGLKPVWYDIRTVKGPDGKPLKLKYLGGYKPDQSPFELYIGEGADGEPISFSAEQGRELWMGEEEKAKDLTGRDFQIVTAPTGEMKRINKITGEVTPVLDEKGNPIKEDKPKDDKEAWTRATTLRKEYGSVTKTYRDVRDSYARIQESAKDPSAAGDLALIFNYMKMLDPASVVRESEFATAANAAGVPERVQAMYNRVLSGERLAPDTRNDFVKRSKKLMERQKEQQKRSQSEYERLARQIGVPKEWVIVDYTDPADIPVPPGFEED